MNGAFIIQKRKRRTNVFPLIIGPYSSNLDDVIRVIRSFLVELDTSIVIEIDRQETLVYTITAYFIADILQQQENSGFISQRAEFSCRFYKYSSKDQKALDLDITTRGRYYQEVIRLRKRLYQCPTKVEKKRFIQAIGNTKSIDIKVVELAIQRIVLALNIIATRGPKLAYSELGRIVKIVVQLLVEAVLIALVANEFVKVLRLFVFLPDCPYLLSPTRHIGSYSLTQYSIQSFVVPPLLRCQLRTKHIRPYFLSVLPIVIGKHINTISRLLAGVSNPEIIYIHIITLYYARIARSVRMLLVDKLSVA